MAPATKWAMARSSSLSRVPLQRPSRDRRTYCTPCPKWKMQRSRLVCCKILAPRGALRYDLEGAARESFFCCPVPGVRGLLSGSASAALELADLAAGGEVAVEGGEAQVALAVLRRKDHPLRLNAAQLHRLQVGDDDDLLAYQVLRLVMLLDARDDLALLGAYLQLQDQQAVGLRVLFGVDHRRHAQLELGEIVDGDLGLVLDWCLLGFLLDGFRRLLVVPHRCL